MHFRAPSSAITTGASTMRRRSAGAMAYKNGLRELSSATSHSQPNVSLMSGRPSEDGPGSPSSPYIVEGNLL